MNYSTLMGDLFRLPLYFNTGALGSSTSESDVSDGDSQHLDTVCLLINLSQYQNEVEIGLHFFKLMPCSKNHEKVNSLL
jgi:hypothetical protein